MTLRTLAIEQQIQANNQNARLSLSGYTTFALVEQQSADPDSFAVYLDDHQTGKKEKQTDASTLQGAVDLARTALLAKAQEDDIAIDGLEVVSD